MHPMPSCGTVLSYGLLPPALAPENPASNPPVLSGNVTSVRNSVFAGKIFFFTCPEQITKFLECSLAGVGLKVEQRVKLKVKKM